MLDYLKKGRIDIIWDMLREFGYDDNLDLTGHCYVQDVEKKRNLILKIEVTCFENVEQLYHVDHQQFVTGVLIFSFPF
jgi:hypothetical protein